MKMAPDNFPYISEIETRGTIDIKPGLLDGKSWTYGGEGCAVKKEAEIPIDISLALLIADLRLTIRRKTVQ